MTQFYLLKLEQQREREQTGLVVGQIVSGPLQASLSVSRAFEPPPPVICQLLCYQLPLQIHSLNQSTLDKSLEFSLHAMKCVFSLFLRSKNRKRETQIIKLADFNDILIDSA